MSIGFRIISKITRPSPELVERFRRPGCPERCYINRVLIEKGCTII